MSKINLLITFLLLAGASTAGAQLRERFDPQYYVQPLKGRLIFSGNFAEARPNHFHSGIDLKTDGVEGKPVYAVADGYVNRINIAPFGYGNALYVSHPNGTTSVYAHLQRFSDEIQQFLIDEQYRHRKHSGDFYYEKNARNPKFPVKKGEIIAYSGNSGSSAGPHLHFELRESGSQRPLNVTALGIYDIKDDIRPTIVKLHYIEVDTIRGVPVNSRPRTFEVVSTAAGQYKTAQQGPLELSRCGYFVLEATDRKNDTHNTMGIYSANMRINDETCFSFSLDSFLFDETRYVNSLTHFAMQKGSRNELLRLAVQANNRLPVYSSVSKRGAVWLDDNEIRNVVIEICDDNENSSRLSFDIKLRSDGRVFNPDAPSNAEVAGGRTQFSYTSQGISFSMPAEAIYEPLFFTVNEIVIPSGGRELFSAIYRIVDEDVPLHKSATVSIDAEHVPPELRNKLCLARITPEGKAYYNAAEYKAGKVTGSVRFFGNYAVVADTVPPKITPSFDNGADLSGSRTIKFRLEDDFSGIGSFFGTIDGNWIAFEQNSREIVHTFEDSRFNYDGRVHKLVLTVNDNKGNSTTIERKFTR